MQIGNWNDHMYLGEMITKRLNQLYHIITVTQLIDND